jgi:hypothetical protein
MVKTGFDGPLETVNEVIDAASLALPANAVPAGAAKAAIANRTRSLPERDDRSLIDASSPNG